jgi:thioredoxin reductase (NADPH)
MVFFTTPELLEIGGLPFVSPYDKPTRVEALRYYRKVADTFDLRISFGEKVLSVERDRPLPSRTEGMKIGHETTSLEEGSPGQESLFAVETLSEGGVRRIREARYVILAIGYYDHPNLIDVPGENLPHVRHYYSEPFSFYRARVVIVGGGNSAAEAALELFRAGALVTLIHRGSALKSTIKYWVRPDIENRIKEGSIEGRFNTVVTEIKPTSVVTARTRRRVEDVDTTGEPSASGRGEDRSAVERDEIPADAVFLLTGYRADSALLRRAGIELTDRDAPVHDASTFETNVPGLFVAGGAIAGVDTGNIFIENGRFHGERIIGVIADRLGA